MNALIIGSGGREHAIGWKLSRSNKITGLFFAPGNAGTANVGQNINILANDFDGIKDIVINQKIEMVIIGHEIPLVEGLVDYLQNIFPRLKIIGPTKEAAILEGSKTFAKNFMLKYNIPTARFQSFTLEKYDAAVSFLRLLSQPYVIKADGLAAGKGVLIIDNYQTACKEIKNILTGKFGEAGNTVVLEQFLSGIELSVFIITDGKNYKILPTAKDYKKIGKADTGLNTGGMGAISPAPFADKVFMSKVEDNIIKPTMSGLMKEGIDFKGFIFFGLINVKDEPFVIEYNVRLGDPEAEVIIPRIENDLADIFLAIVNEEVDKIELKISNKLATTIVLASEGYPESFEIDKEILDLNKISNCIVFHSATKKAESSILTNGGRVLTVTALAETLEQSLDIAKTNADIIKFENKYYRDDIGYEFIN
jgi:phosphoribosylamine--glycine ligase